MLQPQQKLPLRLLLGQPRVQHEASPYSLYSDESPTKQKAFSFHPLVDALPHAPHSKGRPFVSVCVTALDENAASKHVKLWER
jgi:hypothetical protein